MVIVSNTQDRQTGRWYFTIQSNSVFPSREALGCLRPPAIPTLEMSIIKQVCLLPLFFPAGDVLWTDTGARVFIVWMKNA